MRSSSGKMSKSVRQQYFREKMFFIIFFSVVCLSNYYNIATGNVIRNLKFLLMAIMFIYLVNKVLKIRTVLIDKFGLRLTVIMTVLFIIAGSIANQVGGQGHYSYLGGGRTLSDYASLASVLVLLALGYMLSLWFRHNEFKLDMILALRSVALLVVGSNLILFMFHLNFGRGGRLGRFSGWTDNPNTLGIMLMIFFPIIFYLIFSDLKRTWRKRLVDIGILVAIIFLALKTGSRATILSLIIMGGVILVFYSTRTRLVAVFLVVLTFGVVIVDPNIVEDVQGMRQFQRNSNDVLSGRTDAWNLAKFVFYESPCIGYGFGAETKFIKRMLPVTSSHQGEYFHNSYLSLLVAVGILGSAAVFILIAVAVVRLAVAIFKKDAFDGFYVIMSSIFIGSLFHGTFESWLFSLGSISGILFWTSCFYLIQFSHGEKRFEKIKANRALIRKMRQDKGVGSVGQENILQYPHS